MSFGIKMFKEAGIYRLKISKKGKGYGISSFPLKHILNEIGTMNWCKEHYPNVVVPPWTWTIEGEYLVLKFYEPNKHPYVRQS